MSSSSVHSFNSLGTQCQADFYLPEATKPPIVVMAQGYGAERQFGNRNIINALVQAGIAVFAFDYRGFGGSDTIPNQFRQLVDPQRQLEDWQAALNYVRELKEADTSRIALWGSSFAGGHVISVAGSNWVKQLGLKGVVSQIPHCDSRSAFKQVGLQTALLGAYNGLKGALLNSMGVNHTVAIVGHPGDDGFAVMQHPGWYEGYTEMAKDSSTWVNEVPATSLLKVASYNPIDCAQHIDCPVLIVYGKGDQGIPVDDVERTANKIKEVELFAFEGDHFEAYDHGSQNTEVVEKELAFFKKIFEL